MTHFIVYTMLYFLYYILIHSLIFSINILGLQRSEIRIKSEIKQTKGHLSFCLPWILHRKKLRVPWKLKAKSQLAFLQSTLEVEC